MKDLVIAISQNFFAWCALGAGAGAGLFLLISKRSIGKAAAAVIAGAVIAFCCFQPETISNKTNDMMNWALNLIHFG